MRPFAAAALALLLAGCVGAAGPLEPGHHESVGGLGADGGEGTLASSGPQPTGALEGSLVDGAGRPIPNGRVALTPGGWNATSNGAGEFWITGLPRGTYALQADAAGFESQSMPVDVMDAHVAKVAVMLRERPGRVLELEAKEFSFSPAFPEAAFADLPLALAVSNAGLLGHAIAFDVVCACPDGTRTLVSAIVDVPAGASASLVLPIRPLEFPMVRVALPDGAVETDFRNLGVPFADPDFAMLGMEGAIAFG